MPEAYLTISAKIAKIVTSIRSAQSLEELSAAWEIFRSINVSENISSPENRLVSLSYFNKRVSLLMRGAEYIENSSTWAIRELILCLTHAAELTKRFLETEADLGEKVQMEIGFTVTGIARFLELLEPYTNIPIVLIPQIKYLKSLYVEILEKLDIDPDVPPLLVEKDIPAAV